MTEALTDQKWLVIKVIHPRWNNGMGMAISMDMVRDSAIPVLPIVVGELSKRIGWDDMPGCTWFVVPGYWKATGGVHEITVEEADEQGYWT